ncbi:hypothetical protein SAMD00024442_25_23 [Candidatus Symbiothrix dinenymphae]|nr:hypothetical protein SAMD00024442_25_23 [Candidatus Symbiothrix dinenymphae]
MNKLFKFIPLRNLYSLLNYDFRTALHEIDKLNRQVSDLEAKLNCFSYFAEYPELASNFEKELSYLRTHPDEHLVFPYKQLKRLENIQSGYDSKRNLPYVVHNNRKLYFPKTWTEEGAAATYKDFIENENILGGGYKEKAPHQYETDTFCVKEGDVLLDIGCAEALFALNAIDKVKKLYLIESDVVWIEALKATFEPYKNKVEIINKLIADVDTESTITLSSLLKSELSSSLFIKMDIEGYETSVVNSSRSILSENLEISLACCTYHRQSDAEKLNEILTELNFDVEFSDGYMFFVFDKLLPPYFRRGIIRGKKKYNKPV